MAVESKTDVVLYIHGKGGSAKESEHYQSLLPNCEVVGFDYKSNTPWQAKKEFLSKVQQLNLKYKNIIIIANSIGAYFCMNSNIDKYIKKAYFISPIVDMEKLIENMLTWSNADEKQLKNQKIIHTNFGEDLSWEYLCYVRENPIKWSIPTEVLYGEKDNLTSFDIITNFIQKNNNFNLTIMPNGEHWFHTQEQMNFLDNWINNKK